MNETLESKLIPKPLRILLDKISELPDEHRLALSDAAEKATEDTMRRHSLMYKIQAAMGDLRVQVKYLIFDLEATRRERDEASTK